MIIKVNYTVSNPIIKITYDETPIYVSTTSNPIYVSVNYGTGGGGSGTVTSVGLTMPSAFTVTSSPITISGTIAVTGSGTTSQYVRGDGSLATFPTLTSAEDLIKEVYNESGATMAKGTVVYINGSHGNLPTIAKALATGDATSAQTLGMVQTDITDMNNGYIVIIGSLIDMDTQAFANGTQLYLSGVTAGAYTSTKQYAPIHLVYVGIVVRSHPTQGIISVKVQNGFEVDEIHNLSAQNPSNNDGIFYNTSTSLWENKSIATALGYTPQASLTLTTTGTSGAATLISNTLNIPQYSGGAMAIGGSITSATAGSVLFAGTSGILAQDNANLFWDDTNNRLGIGTATPSAILHTVGSVTASSAIARGNYMQPTLVASANSDALVGLDIEPIFTVGAFTGLKYYGLRIRQGTFSGNNGSQINISPTDSAGGVIGSQGGGWNAIGIWGGTRWTTSSVPDFRVLGTGLININTSLLINTTTDAGYKLDVNGTARVSSTITTNQGLIIDRSGNSPYIQLFQSSVSWGYVRASALDTIVFNTGGNVTMATINSTGLILGSPTITAYKINAVSPSTATPTFFFERLTSTTTNAFNEIGRLQNTAATIEMIDGFGSYMSFFARDVTAVNNEQARVGAARSGADDSASLVFYTNNAGTITEKWRINNTGVLSNVSSPNASAVIQIDSTTKGFLPPRMTTTQKNAIATPAAGLMVFDTTLVKLCVYSGTAWETITSV